MRSKDAIQNTLENTTYNPRPQTPDPRSQVHGIGKKIENGFTIHLQDAIYCTIQSIHYMHPIHPPYIQPHILDPISHVHGIGNAIENGLTMRPKDAIYTTDGTDPQHPGYQEDPRPGSRSRVEHVGRSPDLPRIM